MTDFIDSIFPSPHSLLYNLDEYNKECDKIRMQCIYTLFKKEMHFTVFPKWINRIDKICDDNKRLKLVLIDEQTPKIEQYKQSMINEEIAYTKQNFKEVLNELLSK